MAINPNHPFEDINGVRHSIVEKNCNPERAAFLKKLLEHNKFTVLFIPTPIKPVAAPSPDASTEVVSTPAAPETFTVAVTDVMFNTTNAIFGRLLKTPDGKVVTRNYFLGADQVSDDSVPYFEW